MNKGLNCIKVFYYELFYLYLYLEIRCVTARFDVVVVGWRIL